MEVRSFGSMVSNLEIPSLHSGQLLLPVRINLVKSRFTQALKFDVVTFEE